MPEYILYYKPLRKDDINMFMKRVIAFSEMEKEEDVKKFLGPKHAPQGYELKYVFKFDNNEYYETLGKIIHKNQIEPPFEAKLAATFFRKGYSSEMVTNHLRLHFRKNKKDKEGYYLSERFKSEVLSHFNTLSQDGYIKMDPMITGNWSPGCVYVPLEDIPDIF